MKKITGKQKTKTSISLKTMLTGFIVLTISFTTAIVYFPWFFTSKKNIDKIVTQINEEIALSTSKEFTDLFQNVYYTQDFIRSAINRNIVNINNPEERDRFFLSILQSNPDFSFVQFAYPNGDYVGAQRVTTAFEKQNTFKLHFRQWDEERKLAIKTTDQYELSMARSFVEGSAESLVGLNLAPRIEDHTPTLGHSAMCPWGFDLHNNHRFPEP